MMRSLGMPSQRRGLWLAARYREWHVNRMLYVAAAVILVAPTLLTLLTNSREPWGYARGQLAGQVLNYTSGYTGTWSEILILFAGILGIALFWNDRSRGRLDVMLEGPMPRRLMLWAKFYWGVLTVWAVATTLCLAMAVTALAVGHPDWMGPIVVRSLIHAASGTALLVTSVGLGAAMGSVVLTAMGTGVWLLAPVTLASLVYALQLGVFGKMTPETVMVAIQRLSPVAPTPPQGWVGVVYAGYFLAWAIFVGNRALKWWDRAPWERFHDPVYFPVMWNFFYALWALLSGLVLTMVGLLLFSPTGTTTVNFLVGSLIIAVPGWFFWRRFTWFLGRTRLGWEPGA